MLISHENDFLALRFWPVAFAVSILTTLGADFHFCKFLVDFVLDFPADFNEWNANIGADFSPHFRLYFHKISKSREFSIVTW